MVVATKFGRADVGGSRSEIIRSCERSLRRLGTDCIDLYYQHCVDRTTPVDETLAALTQLVEQGKVGYLGSSNVAGWQVAEVDHAAREHGSERFIAFQMEWSVLSRGIEAEVVPACRRYGLGVVAYFPLASGLLTGKYRRGEQAPEGSRFAAPPFFAGVRRARIGARSSASPDLPTLTAGRRNSRLARPPTGFRQLGLI